MIFPTSLVRYGMRKIVKLLGPAVLVFLLACHSPKSGVETDWVFVEGGAFEQGLHQIVVSPGGDTVQGFTSPNRVVEISDFYISRYEITVAEFRAFCEATGRKMPDPPRESAHGQQTDLPWREDHPMLATWEEADAYARWAGGRLPTEAEWEYAAKGGRKSRGYRYSGSDDPAEVGWVAENADSTFHAVGRLKPNELGLYDMTGNVNEWVNDWYNPEMDHLVGRTDPQGPPEGELKIAKGLSWYYRGHGDDGKPLPYGIHLPEVRYQSPPETRNDGFGFRIAKDPVSSPEAQSEVPSENLKIAPLGAHSFLHVSYLETESWGKVPCNGLVLIRNGEAIVCDSPVDSAASAELLDWLQQEMKVRVIAVIATHFHEDCLGGLDQFHQRGIPSYAGGLTRELAAQNGFPLPQQTFESTQTLVIGDAEVRIQYPGEGHTRDNVVVWFPLDKALFGGCLVKSQGAGKGNLNDANTAEWPRSVEAVKSLFGEAAIVVPGHGDPGGTELLDYTIALFRRS